ncbi:MAG TPA: SPFH domain-containing protein [Oscillospiraceae bacterium]|nr:SPFH domain-containing protein [Oscillospiraceae bacterium]
MSWIFLAIAVTVILFIALGYERDAQVLRWRGKRKQLISLFGLLLVVFGCFSSVPTGHTGIVTTFGKVEQNTFEAGVNFKSPVQKVILMDNRNQKATVNLVCFSSDIQEVSIVYSLNYQIRKENAQDIYRTIGSNYFDTVISPRIQESVKVIVAKYKAETLVSERSKLSAEIQANLTETLSKFNIEVISTSVEDMDFTEAFTTAVEAKQVAEQNKLKAITEQEQKVLEAEAAAKQKVIAAQADAETAKIAADAGRYAKEQEAEGNRKLQESITDELIRYKQAERWDGKLPEIYGGDDGVLPIIDNRIQ